MTIKQRVAVASGVPLVFMLLLATFLSWKFWNSYRIDENIKSIVELTVVSSHLVHELQKERGMSAGFIGSSGRKFGKSLREQRAETDKRLKAFMDFINKAKLPKEVRRALEKLTPELQRISEVRRSVDSLGIDKIEVVKFYTNINNSLINLLGTAIHGAENIHIAARILAIKEFSSAKDLEGIKRALLSVIFAQDRLERDMLMRYADINGREEAFLSSFKSVAPKEYLKRYAEVISKEEFQEALKLEKLITQKVWGYGVDPEHWFAVQTKKINLLKDMEDFMLADTEGTVNSMSRRELMKFAFVSSLSVVILIGAFLTALKTLRAVSERIDEVVREVEEVSENMSFKVDITTNSKDEFTPLERALADMFKSIGSAISSITSVMREVAEGEFNKRAEGKFRGDIKLLVDEINLSLENLQSTISAIKDVMKEIAKGNLKERISINQKGELRELVDYINSSIGDLRELLLHIREDISHVSENIANINVSIEETSEAIRQISQETIKAREVSSEVDKAIEVGKTKVETMHTTIGKIVEVSKNITTITNTIITIAEQTNLLALNAAIEAARAGELGKGFAVVADEVRRLAEISGNAAKEIAQLVENVVRTVEEGKEVSDAVVESYSKIEAITREMSTIISNIATAMEEQSRAIELMRNNMTEISSSTQNIEEEMDKFKL